MYLLLDEPKLYQLTNANDNVNQIQNKNHRSSKIASPKSHILTQEFFGS